MDVASSAVRGHPLIAPERAAHVTYRRTRLAVGLLVVGAALFRAGESTPSLADAWDASAERRLEIIAAHESAWIRASLLMGAGALVQAGGLVFLTDAFRRGPGRRLAEAGLGAFLLGVLCWLILCSFRLVVSLGAARDLDPTPNALAFYDTVEDWAVSLAGAYMLLGGLAFLAFWGALLRNGLTGRVRWLVIVFGLAMVAAIAGIPLVVNVDLALLGLAVLILTRGRERERRRCSPYA
ncbi:MAG: hypothetical protein ACRDJW_24420 [Thermomicrobiales bacterium]